VFPLLDATQVWLRGATRRLSSVRVHTVLSSEVELALRHSGSVGLGQQATPQLDSRNQQRVSASGMPVVVVSAGVVSRSGDRSPEV